MIDFAAARRMMVDGQVRTSDVTDLRLIVAMQAVPRERFVPAGKAELAYLDLDLPVAEGAAGGEAGERARERYLLKPMVLAKLLQTAGVGEGDRVLDVGCATGYSSAVLGRLVASVVALEQEAELARLAQGNLMAVGTRNVEVVTGPLTEGWPPGAPYDVILLNGASEVAPQALLGQLKEGGRLVGVIGRAPVTRAMLYIRSNAGDVSGRAVFDAVAPLLPGFAQPAAFVF
jgi:protein-L-isoaspartate(D-aspartate) O-methyltransferase